MSELQDLLAREVELTQELDKKIEEYVFLLIFANIKTFMITTISEKSKKRKEGNKRWKELATLIVHNKNHFLHPNGLSIFSVHKFNWVTFS